MRPIGLAILFAFALLVLIGVVLFVANDGIDERAKIQEFLIWTTRAVGLFIAATAALILLLAGVGAVPADGLPVLVVALLGGLLLITQDWGLAIALGAVAAAMVWRGYSARPRSLDSPVMPTDRPAL